MTTPSYLAKLEADLTKEDWQFIYTACLQRFKSARPTKSEGKPSKEFLDQEERISFFLSAKAFG